MSWILSKLGGPIATLIVSVVGVGGITFVIISARTVIKELLDLVDAIMDALDDEKLTNKEISNIIKEGKEVYETIKDLRK